ncbi:MULTISPECIES: NPCBM/NEW2 domain-containing protein [unclassified Bacillus (in: firmicutes)]|uniref:NPCBM/NEW2 domain-containing protein n=1 Tax=unclassified Bacillus (in: firmicutes) TaxID=185979 RepID=UPI001BE6E28C|nr:MULTISPECIES: NPCBM/NEW2 domain-containing protein [unclassified Bacillus (in: firmicutes)]MBT2614107.1 NPCBM/NEW2 domain-containing protein [Bacillus sp. ISL-78]MBT2629382.1 NPCBM/NEW2 domain-containing protein [Bacillus sp. ISL-101]
MKKTFVSLAATALLLISFTFVPQTTKAAPSTATLQKQVDDLKKQVNTKDKEIKSLKGQITTKNGEIASLKKNAATPINAKLTYQNQSKTNSLLTYKGKTYAQLDTVGGLLRLGVSYVKKDNTWYMGENSNGVYMSDILSTYVGGSATIDSNTTMAGVAYKKGQEYDIFSDTYKYAYNLQGKYTTIKGLLGYNDDSIDDDDFTGTVSFYGDGKFIKSYTMKTRDLPTSVTLSVKGVKKLEVKTSLKSIAGYEYGSVKFANAKIY